MPVAQQESLFGRLDQPMDMIEPVGLGRAAAGRTARGSAARRAPASAARCCRASRPRSPTCSGAGRVARCAGEIGARYRAAERGKICGDPIAPAAPSIESSPGRRAPAGAASAASTGWRSTSPSRSGRPRGSNIAGIGARLAAQLGRPWPRRSPRRPRVTATPASAWSIASRSRRSSGSVPPLDSPAPPPSPRSCPPPCSPRAARASGSPSCPA